MFELRTTKLKPLHAYPCWFLDRLQSRLQTYGTPCTKPYTQHYYLQYHQHIAELNTPRTKAIGKSFKELS